MTHAFDNQKCKINYLKYAENSIFVERLRCSLKNSCDSSEITNQNKFYRRKTGNVNLYKIFFNHLSHRIIRLRSALKLPINKFRPVEISNFKMIETLPTPVKSANDSKDYKVIKLPNGLKVLLISDTSYDLEKLDQEEDDLEHDKENDEDSGGEEEEEEDMEDQESEDEEDEKSGSSGLKKSAAGLCIGMGCFSDPMELQGLAHFLEHMVFMGSKKYPSENEFDKFVSDHGGFDNAHTDCENTTFYFEVQRRYLAK